MIITGLTGSNGRDNAPVEDELLRSSYSVELESLPNLRSSVESISQDVRRHKIFGLNLVTSKINHYNIGQTINDNLRNDKTRNKFLLNKR